VRRLILISGVMGWAGFVGQTFTSTNVILVSFFPSRRILNSAILKWVLPLTVRPHALQIRGCPPNRDLLPLLVGVNN
jgi:hypothetical protein